MEDGVLTGHMGHAARYVMEESRNKLALVATLHVPMEEMIAQGLHKKQHPVIRLSALVSAHLLIFPM